MKKIIMKEMDIGKLKPARYNPRKNLQPGDAEYEALKKSIERWDLVEPLVWNESTGNLVGGHQRLKICKQLGMKRVQVVVVKLDDTKERLLNVALNRIAGAWDYGKLSEILKEYRPEDLGITGLSSGEIAGLLSNTEAAYTDIMEQRAAEESATATGGEKYDVYLSFPGKKEAEEWLAENGYEARFKPGSRSLAIRDEGGANNED